MGEKSSPVGRNWLKFYLNSRIGHQQEIQGSLDFSRTIKYIY